jgi:hypothetical protein
LSKQQKLQQYIYKLDSSLLELKHWDLKLPLEQARKMDGVIVALADSQILSWINEINGTQDYDIQAKNVKRQIKFLKKQETNAENRAKISELYKELYRLQFREDYVSIVMKNNSHYMRANKGFKINGIQYKRLLCTVGGVKMSTVVYVSERIHEELKKRLANNHNWEVPLVPAKYSAYEALSASGSNVVSWPDDSEARIPGGTIVVRDVIVNFLADFIDVDDSNYPCEPVVELKKDQEFENNANDGCGIMTVELAKRWNGELTGDYDRSLCGCNLRNAFTKGMVFPFDIVRFAEEINGASEEHPEKYLVEDVWGTKRDVRDAHLIITESQLKLWKSYDSWEHYYESCIENGYTFRVAKTAANYEEMDEVRQLNYQFIAPLELTRDDVKDLIKPTVDEISDILGGDYRKTLVYLCGSKLNDDNVNYSDVVARAIMINPELVGDDYVFNRIHRMIKRRITDAKIGVLDVRGNFQILSGDLYALAQSMFGLPVTGLLKSGEIYSKFWLNRNVKEVLCYRAPMSNEHSIVRQRICTDEVAQDWFRYMESIAIVSPWDTMPAALNGFDYDGDLLFTTDNEPLMRRQTNLPALRCIQHNAKKEVVTEENLIQSNINGFGSKIGQITNRCTSMTSLMANYTKDDEEYKVLKYRTQCMQAVQQAEIDKAKGIKTYPMQKSWYILSECKQSDEYTDEYNEKMEFYEKICAHKKPYFFGYNYPSLMKEYRETKNRAITNARQKFRMELDDMLTMYERGEGLTEDQRIFIERFLHSLNLDSSKSTCNMICWEIEDTFDNKINFAPNKVDLYTLLRRNEECSPALLDKITKLCKKSEKKKAIKCAIGVLLNNQDSEYDEEYSNVDYDIADILSEVCNNEEQLCDLLLDYCYKYNGNKEILWNVCGETIIKRLSSENSLFYPIADPNGDFEVQGKRYLMREYVIGGDENEV